MSVHLIHHKDSITQTFCDLLLWCHCFPKKSHLLSSPRLSGRYPVATASGKHCPDLRHGHGPLEEAICFLEFLLLFWSQGLALYPSLVLNSRSFCPSLRVVILQVCVTKLYQSGEMVPRLCVYLIYITNAPEDFADTSVRGVLGLFQCLCTHHSYMCPRYQVNP